MNNIDLLIEEFEKAHVRRYNGRRLRASGYDLIGFGQELSVGYE